MHCDAKPCREVSYAFDLHLHDIEWVEGDDCPHNPDDELLGQIKENLSEELRKKFPNRDAECPAGCQCEFDTKATTKFERKFSWKVVTTPSDAPVTQRCTYSGKAAVTITRIIRSGACEPTPETVEDNFKQR